jgi:hypothetical protein
MNAHMAPKEASPSTIIPKSSMSGLPFLESDLSAERVDDADIPVRR